MTYSKLGNIKGPQGRRGLNMTGGATTPPTVDDNVLEGDLWLDSVTGDVYRATDPWANDGSWHTWGTVLWKGADNVLMVQPAEGGTGTLGREPCGGDGWCNFSNNPSMVSITSVRSKEGIAMNADSTSLFSNYTSLTDISPISGWDMSGVTNMSSMFSNCTSLTNLSPISGWDVSGVTYMDGMFQDCTSLTDISPISDWNVSGVTGMWDTFSNCTSLIDISALSSWDVSNVTRMNAAFYSCNSLTNLSALSGWDVSGVTDMSSMFLGCTSLTDISALSGWDISGVTNVATMFSGCTSLTDISALFGWDMSGVTNMKNMFRNCPLERIGVPSLDHGGKNFVSNLKSASVVTDLNATMLTNTTTHESMSANQILTDMDANPSKYATGTIWTIARA